MKLKKTYNDINNDIIIKAMEKFSLPFSLVNYIYNLGYDTIDKIADYLSPSAKYFYDPFLFPDMRKICDRINIAIKNKERILIFGDYDADGIGSTAILYKYFESVGLLVDYFLPSRYSDGYGLTKDSIDKVNKQFNPNLIITVDCGITCIEEVEYAKSLGIDMIITDHHEPLEILPNCPVIDCKIKNQVYPFSCLCGAGMALKVVYALSDFQTAKKYFTICAISTIADIVELVDENRFIVVEGLKNFEKDCPVGLKYLFKKLKIKDTPNSTDISYKFAPKINATGRMGDATISLKLYLENSNEKIAELVKKVISMNEERQIICQKIFEKAQEMINEMPIQNDNVIVLKSDDWETGVLGIVCAKMIENYNKSVILLGLDKRTGNYVGSARAVEGVNIYDAISKCSDLLVTFGGHEMAAGLTLCENNYNNFKVKINSVVSANSSDFENYLKYDIECSESEFNFDFLNNLNRLEPFGVANPKPKFIIKSKNLYTYPMSNHNEHLLVKFNRFSGVLFNKPYYIYTLNNHAKKSVFCTPFIETFGNSKQIKLFIDNVYCNDINKFNKDISRGLHFKQNIYALSCSNNCNIYTISSSELAKMPSKKVLYISYYSEIKKEVLSSINCDVVDFVYLSHKLSDNTLLISPNNYDGFGAFENIVFVDEICDKNFLNYINFKYPNAKIYLLKDVKNEKISVKTDKEVFINFYNIMKSINEKFFDEINMYKKYFSKFGFSFSQYLFCLYVFEDLGIIKLFNEKGFYFEIDEKKRTNLYNSTLYCKMLAK